MHNKKKESELTNGDRGEIFKSDVYVELDNNEHIDDDFKFKIFVAKELMCMIYYIIAEIPQEFRSKLSSIFLLACVKTSHVKNMV